MMFFDEADQALQEGVALDVVSLGAAVYALCPTWRAAQAGCTTRTDRGLGHRWHIIVQNAAFLRGVGI